MGSNPTLSAIFIVKGENTLVASVPGQPEYELIPYKGTEFNLKNLTGYSIEFVLDESGNVIKAKFKQPDGILPLKRNRLKINLLS